MVFKSEKGITLMELMVAASVMAILAAVAIPSVKGFVGKGKEKAYEGDQQVLQLATDIWRNTIGKTSGTVWPILEGGDGCLGTIDLNTGIPNVGGCNPYLNIGAIATQNFIPNASAIKSSDTSRNTTATNNPSGSYGWYINSSGEVTSFPVFANNIYP